jgi:uncharacterized membrane protein YbhN (UPF0104 family)
MKKFFQSLTAIAILFFLLWYLVGHWQQLRQLVKFSAGQIATMYLLCLAVIYINAVSIKIVLKSFGKKTSLVEMLNLNNAVYLLNYAPMKAGTIFRGVYLKKHHNLSYSHFTSFFVYMTVLTGASSSLLAAIAMALFTDLSEPKIRITAVFFSAAAIGLSVLLFVPLPIPKGQNKLSFFLGQFLDGKKIISSNLAVVAKAGLLMMLLSFITAVRLGIIYYGIDQQINPAGLLVFAALDCLSLFISFTPGNLGLRELLFSAGAVGLGIPLDVGLFAAMIDRAVLVVYAFTAGAASTVILWRKTPADFKNISEKPALNGKNFS